MVEKVSCRLLAHRGVLVWGVTLGFVALGLWLLDVGRADQALTFDEPNHLATGLEWWQLGSYTWWTETPPLGRLLAALGPYLSGARLPDREAWDPLSHSMSLSWDIGVDTLYRGAGYAQTLRVARWGTAPAFLVTLLCTWLLARGRERPLTGLLAVGLVATLPSLLGHAALATTDVALVATVLLYLVALDRYAYRPSRGLAVAVGVSAGLALGTKYSSLAFLPLTTACLAWVHWRARRGCSAAPLRRPPVGHVGVAAAAAALVLWALYRFSVGTIAELPPGDPAEFLIFPPPEQRTSFQNWWLSLPLPAPEWFHGLLFSRAHLAAGHVSYLMGERSSGGFLGFYFLSLLWKTPLTFLFAGGLSLAVSLLSFSRAEVRGEPPPLTSALAARWAGLSAVVLVAVAGFSPTNLGTRHIFLVLPLLAVAIAHVLTEGVRGRGLALLDWRSGLAALLAWAPATGLLLTQTALVVRERHELLSFFNTLAGKDPGAKLVDSDFDWGQDFFRLRDYLREQGADTVKLAVFANTRQCAHGLPLPQALPPGVPTTGWIAVSENFYRGQTDYALLGDPCDASSWYPPSAVPPQPYAWLEEHQLVARLGAIRVYHIPEPRALDAGQLRRADLAPVAKRAGAAADGSAWRIDAVTGHVAAPALEPGVALDAPGSVGRVLAWDVELPKSGPFDVYLKFQVGADGFRSDSLYLAAGFGHKAPTKPEHWDVVNGLTNLGYSGLKERVGAERGAHHDRPWRWINLSELLGHTEHPFVATVAGGAQRFELGAREARLRIDEVAFVEHGVAVTVEELEKRLPGLVLPAPAPPPAYSPTGPPPAAGADKYLGCAFSSDQSQNFEHYFNQLTPENSGKWGNIEPVRDAMNFSSLDKAFAFAARQFPPLPVKLHTLIWGNQQPEWIKELPPAEQREEIAEWFAALAERYGPRIASIEVVNEPLHDPPNKSDKGGGNYIEALGGAGESGWDWVLEAFRMARQHFPWARLLINEYGIVSDEELARQYSQLAEQLKAERLLDGIGVQGHAFSTRVDASVMKSNLDIVAAVGLPILVTEFEIDGADDLHQLMALQRVFPVFWEHPAVEGVTLWGYRPGMWRTPQGATLVHSNGAERPSMVWLRKFVERSAASSSSVWSWLAL